jgi:hypothetical protein
MHDLGILNHAPGAFAGGRDKLTRRPDPIQGRMSFEHTGPSLAEQPEMKLIAYTPLETDDADRKFAELLE